MRCQSPSALATVHNVTRQVSFGIRLPAQVDRWLRRRSQPAIATAASPAGTAGGNTSSTSTCTGADSCPVNSSVRPSTVTRVTRWARYSYVSPKWIVLSSARSREPPLARLPPPADSAPAGSGRCPEQSFVSGALLLPDSGVSSLRCSLIAAWAASCFAGAQLQQHPVFPHLGFQPCLLAPAPLPQSPPPAFDIPAERPLAFRISTK